MTIKIPAFGFYEVLVGLRTRLEDQSLWREPNVFADVSTQDITDFRTAFSKPEAGGRPLRVGYIYPEADVDLPAVTLVPEGWSTEEAVLGEWGGTLSRGVECIEGEVLTANAVGGETAFQLRHPNVVLWSETVVRNGDPDAYLPGVDYTVNATEGIVTLTAALAPGDTLSISYQYLTSVNARDVFGEISRQTVRLFVEANNPVTLMLLVGLIWRELTIKRAYLEHEHGVKNLAIRVEALSDWTEVLPAVAFRQEFVLDYMVTQSAEVDLGPQPTAFQLEIAAAPSTTTAETASVASLELGVPEGVEE